MIKIAPTPSLIAAAVLVGLLAAAPSQAQTPDARQEPAPFRILDNSFLVEEAFNQPQGVFQNILGWTRTNDGTWESTFTQEWPISSLTHQLSYTLPFTGGGQPAHVGAVLVNYRFQLLEEHGHRPAFSPRVSLILPTGRSEDADNQPGLQVNLPVSKQAGDLYFHWNAGVTWLHSAPFAGGKTNLTSPHLAASAIWRTTPLFHLMLESVVAFEQSIAANQLVQRERVVTMSPGFRRAWNIGDQQVVVGAAVPVSIGDADTSVGALTYFSYELPFQK